jgi:hypothetical protein
MPNYIFELNLFLKLICDVFIISEVTPQYTVLSIVFYTLVIYSLYRKYVQNIDIDEINIIDRRRNRD